MSPVTGVSESLHSTRPILLVICKAYAIAMNVSVFMTSLATPLSDKTKCYLVTSISKIPYMRGLSFDLLMKNFITLSGFWKHVHAEVHL